MFQSASVNATMIPAPARFPLIVFDVLEQNWLGCFDPILDTCARSILDRIALVDERIFKLCLLRTFPLPCVQPNLMNWTCVTVMVVHESPWVLDIDGHTQVESRHALGMHPTWMWGSAMPPVATATAPGTSAKPTAGFRFAHRTCRPSNVQLRFRLRHSVQSYAAHGSRASSSTLSNCARIFAYSRPW